MPNLAIKASGMVTAAGFNSTSSCAAMRAGIRNVNQTNLWDAESGEYLTAGRVLLPHWWTGLGKLAELLTPAIWECLEAARPIPGTQIPILLILSSPQRPYRLTGLNERILEELQERLGFELHRASQLITRDHISLVLALKLVQELIERGRATYCIIAAVDSLLQQDLVEYLLKQRRLLTPMNSNGFAVGEAGSAVLVGTTGGVSEGELEILGMGVAHETASIESEDPLRGDGLAQAIGQALRESGLTIQEIHYS